MPGYGASHVRPCSGLNLIQLPLVMSVSMESMPLSVYITNLAQNLFSICGDLVSDFNAFLISRNLRIREDTAKYLLNLDVNSAYYDPKTRSMREDPLPDMDPNEKFYLVIYNISQLIIEYQRLHPGFWFSLLGLISV